MSPQTELALWIAQPVLQSAVAGAMLWRKTRPNFPRFFNYLIFQIASFAVLFPIFQWGGYEQYFYGYWSYSAINLVLGFMVIYEVFLEILHPYPTLQDLGAVLFQWAALVMLLVAVVVAASSPASLQGPLVQAIVTVQRCVRVVQVGLILFLLVFSRYLGISSRHHSFGITLGFGTYAATELTMFALHASNHATQGMVNLVDLVSCNLAIAVWFVYCVRRSVASAGNQRVLASARWEQGLSDLQTAPPSESLIYMFEGMVDRALSRNTTEPRLAIAANSSEFAPVRSRSGLHTFPAPKKSPSSPGLLPAPVPAITAEVGN